MHSGRGDVVIFIFIYLVQSDAAKGGGRTAGGRGWWRHRSTTLKKTRMGKWMWLGMGMGMRMGMGPTGRTYSTPFTRL